MKKLLILLSLLAFEYIGVYSAVTGAYSNIYFNPVQSMFTQWDYLLFAIFGIVIIIVVLIIELGVMDVSDKDLYYNFYLRVKKIVYVILIVVTLYYVLDLIIPGTYIHDPDRYYENYKAGYFIYPTIIIYYGIYLFKLIKQKRITKSK